MHMYFQDILLQHSGVTLLSNYYLYQQRFAEERKNIPVVWTMSQDQVSVLLLRQTETNDLDSDALSICVANCHWAYKDLDLQTSLKMRVFIFLCSSCWHQRDGSSTPVCSGNKLSQGLIVLCMAGTTILITSHKGVIWLIFHPAACDFLIPSAVVLVYRWVDLEWCLELIQWEAWAHTSGSIPTHLHSSIITLLREM